MLVLYSAAMKHPWIIIGIVFWLAIAIRPQLLTGQMPTKQNPTTLRIACVFLALACVAFMWFVP